VLLACQARDGLAVSCGVSEQLGEQRRRLALQRSGERFHPRARETHAIIGTYTFMHNLFSAGGLTGLGTTERCDQGRYVTADQTRQAIREAPNPERSIQPR
jgi:hypothetical protein